MKFKQIPTIDLTPWKMGDYTSEIDGLIERSLDDYGFMNLVGHEIRGSIVRSLVYELQAYFDRPFEQKPQI